MDKYYTPETKEIYPGYKFQVKDDPTEDWMDSEITIFHDLSNVNLWIMDGELRTKYLTKEDIESLGWKWQRTYDRNGTYRGIYPTKMEFKLGDVWKMGGGYLEFKPETTEIKITTVDEGFNADGPNHSIKYQGKAKSINELKKILEWVL